MEEKLVAECQLVSSLVGETQHVVWCLLGLVLHVPQYSRGQLALLGLQGNESFLLGAPSLQSQLGSMR